MTSEKRGQKFHTDDASLPRSGMGSASGLIEVPLVEIYARFSDSISRGDQWWRREMSAVFSGYGNLWKQSGRLFKFFAKLPAIEPALGLFGWLSPLYSFFQNPSTVRPAGWRSVTAKTFLSFLIFLNNKPLLIPFCFLYHAIDFPPVKVINNIIFSNDKYPIPGYTSGDECSWVGTHD